ncbi:fbox domain containing protein [Phytophthora cinnamomi]|uniref:fbox domain containing protein n=1 Tax=Phytophthora cinnamomi TaxID=4785 RepID=UPI00355A50C7|nr:fbox domain containing protein [Phytophthora cinnamomi]
MTVAGAGVWLLRAYVDLLLFVPRLLLELNLAWNPLVILARRALRPLLQTLTGTTTTGTMADDSGMRWLQPGERGGERVAIVSYPRCGNSLMRGLLEKVTGVYTGCDTRPDRSLSKELQQYGMKGEGVVDESVWFVKTHFPERVGYRDFPVRKAILVVRNPWDAIDSYFNMTLTNTHNKSLHESQYARFADRWDGLLRNEIDVWMKFHRYWTTKVDIPIIVVRYEDLMMHREETLRRVFLFLTDRTTLEGTEWETRIRDVMATSGDKAGPYKPRSGKIGGSFRHYSDEQFQYILKTANLPLRGFGYDPETQNFPTEIALPKRQVKPGKTADAQLLISIDPAMEIRKKNDSFGRGSTYFRRALTEPVIANDGTELNMDEVLAARERLQAKKEEEAAAEKLENLTVKDAEKDE